MYIANELKKTIPMKNMEIIKESFANNIFEILYHYIEDKSMFNIDNFTLYYLDEYELSTSCHTDIFSTLYIEINQPLNYKINTKSKKRNVSDKYVIPELYLTLSNIRTGLKDAFLQHFDSNNIIWLDKYSICVKSTVVLEDGDKSDYYFRVIPAFTYHNKDNKHGLVYYANNDIQIEYPELFIKNYAKKNKQTKDMFRQISVIFKNILLKEKDIERLPSEIIETLVYNVPNEMLKKDTRESMINILNFLRNNPLKSFKTIDEQDFAFSSLYRSMSILYCKHILKIIEKYITK